MPFDLKRRFQCDILFLRSFLFQNLEQMAIILTKCWAFYFLLFSGCEVQPNPASAKKSVNLMGLSKKEAAKVLKLGGQWKVDYQTPAQNSLHLLPTRLRSHHSQDP